jgi:hypothetical protein
MGPHHLTYIKEKDYSPDSLKKPVQKQFFSQHFSQHRKNIPGQTYDHNYVLSCLCSSLQIWNVKLIVVNYFMGRASGMDSRRI